MTQPERHDFSKIIAELEAVGVTHYKLAIMMRRQLVQVQRWAKGSEPRHYEGEMLLAIHAAHITSVTVPST